MPIYRVSAFIGEKIFETEVQQFFASAFGKENVFQLSDAEWLVDYSSGKENLMKIFDSITAKAEIFISEIFKEHIIWYMKPEKENAYKKWLGQLHHIRLDNHIKSGECTL